MSENEERSKRGNYLTGDRRRLFHINYKYMWNTLGSSPYRVRNAKGDIYAANGKKIEGRKLLPAYSICSQCFKEKTNVTENTVYNIVAFFNANFRPMITPQQFWS